MSISQTSGIVLKTQNWRETSKLVTLYTEDFGKIKAIAKGLKVKKGKGTGGLGQFSENEIIFYKKRNGLHLIDKWNFKDSNSALYGSFKKLVIASIMVEIVNGCVSGEERNPRLYGLLKTALGLLGGGGDEELFLASFMLHFLDNLGYKPHLERCSRCKTEKFSGPLFFALNKGSLTCGNCKTDKDRLVVVDREMKGALKYLQNISVRKSTRLKLMPLMQKKICNFLISFLTYTLDREIKSVSLLEAAAA